jgi:hypothetical protein
MCQTPQLGITPMMFIVIGGLTYELHQSGVSFSIRAKFFASNCLFLLSNIIHV